MTRAEFRNAVAAEVAKLHLVGRASEDQVIDATLAVAAEHIQETCGWIGGKRTKPCKNCVATADKLKALTTKEPT